MTDHEATAAQPDVEMLITQAARLLVEAAQPERVILFGSYARGDYTKDSDLDLLVIMPSVENRFAEMNRLRNVLTPLHFPIDVLVYSTREVAERGHLPGSTLRWALEEGKILYAAA